MSWTRNVKTSVLAAGSSVTITSGRASIDMLYVGTGTGCTWTGSTPDSVPVLIPQNIPFTLEYNQAGLPAITITNGGNGNCYIVEKF